MFFAGNGASQPFEGIVIITVTRNTAKNEIAPSFYSFGHFTIIHGHLPGRSECLL